MLGLELSLLHFVSSLMSPNFSHRYDYSLSTSFSSKSCEKCRSILFLSHLSFVFFATSSFICLVPLCNSVLRSLAVCNTAELMRLCVLAICINGYCLLSAYSTGFVTSTVYASSNCIRSLPPYYLGTYKRSMPLGNNVHGWLEVFISRFCIIIIIIITSNRVSLQCQHSVLKLFHSTWCSERLLLAV